MFLNLIMLAGIAGAAVPLILHLLSRARYRNLQWGAMMFLGEADVRQRRSSRLRQWLLLAIRMAIVALLAIALARPVVSEAFSSVGQSPGVVAVILLDHSASMSQPLSAGLSSGQVRHTRMEEARDAVGQILSSLHRGDQVALITLGDLPSSPSATTAPTTDLQSVADTLNNPRLLETSLGVANQAEGLRAAANLFERQSNPNRELFTVCDRQALSWRYVSDKFAEGWRSRMAVPGPPPRFFVVPIGANESQSVAVESIAIDSPQMVVGQTVDAVITVHNYGPSARSAVPVSLQADDRSAGSKRVNIPPRATAAVRLPIRIDAAGSHLIAASIDLPATVFDRFSIAVDVVPPIGVLIIRGKPETYSPESNPDFLKLALMPFASARLPASDLAVVQVIDHSATDDWSQLDLRKYQVVILDNFERISDAQSRALEQFVNAGGGAIISPGYLSSATNINAMLNRQGAGLLPAKLGGIRGENLPPTMVSELERAHPIFQFSQAKNGGISSVIVTRYFQVTSVQGDARVLARFGTRDPFVIGGTFGRGKVLLLTTPLDKRWGTLPVTRFYLPFVQSMARFLAAKPSRNLHAGDTIVADFETLAGDTNALVVTPSGVRHEVPLETAGEFYEARYQGASEPGVYTVTANHQVEHFVIAPPVEEADLTPLTDEQLATFSDQLGFKTVDLTQTSLTSAIASNAGHTEIWAILIGIVCVLGFGEVLLGRVLSEDVAESNIGSAE